MFDEIVILMKKYTGAELFGHILERIRTVKASGDTESAQEGCMAGMTICMKQVSQSEDDLYYNAFFDFYHEYIGAIDSENMSEDIIIFTISAAGQLDRLAASALGNAYLNAMTMDLFEKGAAYGMNNNMPEVAMELYERQRDKLIGYSGSFDVSSRIARVDANLIMPYVLCREPESAKIVGAEAYDIMCELYEENPKKYASDLFDICSNLGGVYMDANELDEARKVLTQALEIWNDLPESEKAKNLVQKFALDSNMEKLENK